MKKINSEVKVYYEDILRETSYAFYLQLDNSDIFNPIRHWMSKSQIIDHDEDKNYVVIPKWLAVRKRLV
jgi:hypothetical protein